MSWTLDIINPSDEYNILQLKMSIRLYSTNGYGTDDERTSTQHRELEQGEPTVLSSTGYNLHYVQIAFSLDNIDTTIAGYWHDNRH